MTIKRVDELEAGDIVTPPYDKSVLTVESVTKYGDRVNKVYYVGIRDPWLYGTTEEFTYLGKRIEETMKTPKVDCSALYPYFDSLAKCEASEQKSASLYVHQQLQFLHKLFEDVLGLSLTEIKTLYFERKMSQHKTKIKKVKDLCIGDKVLVYLPDQGGDIKGRVTQLSEYSSTEITIHLGYGTVAVYGKEREVTLVD